MLKNMSVNKNIIIIKKEPLLSGHGRKHGFFAHQLPVDTSAKKIKTKKLKWS
jgi:hypothetical protein